MDYERCAALHNKLVVRTWTCSDEEWYQPSTYWEHYMPSEETARRFSQPVVEFLKRAHIGPDGDALSLFYFVVDLPPPDVMFESPFFQNETFCEPSRYIGLYPATSFYLGDELGIVFDQFTQKATFVPDYNDFYGIIKREWGWIHLENILVAYLEMLDQGKIMHVPVAEALVEERDRLNLQVATPIGPWGVAQYTSKDIEKSVASMKRLVEAIDSRISNIPVANVKSLPWTDPAILSHDLVPPLSFAHEFLREISSWKVGFCYIAPGVRFPTKPEFLDQPIKVFSPENANYKGKWPEDCPLRIFENGSRDDDLRSGFYIDRVIDAQSGYFSHGTRLVLPFTIGAEGWARSSNGAPIGDTTEHSDPEPMDERDGLYQPGYPDGFLVVHFVQLQKVLDNWADRVEAGDWIVNENGIVGGIGKFREAHTEEHWQKYWIEPSW